MGNTPEKLFEATVYAAHGAQCTISLYPESTMQAVAAGTLNELPTVGDRVRCVTPEGSSLARVVEILPRTTSLTRRKAGSDTEMQVMAANMTHVAIVMGLDGNYSLTRLQRMVALAYESGATPLVLLTKADTVQPADLALMLYDAENASPGVDIALVSAQTGEGMTHVQSLMTPERTFCFIGSSGAGKSTLLNALAGSSLRETQEVRASDSRGRHTTTDRRMFTLPNGCRIIDLPGVREAGLTGEDGVTAAYDDIARLAEDCRFGDCSHTTEPGCAVLTALSGGRLPQERYESWLKLTREARHYADTSAKKAWEKSVAKSVKNYYRTMKGKRG